MGDPVSGRAAEGLADGSGGRGVHQTQRGLGASKVPLENSFLATAPLYLSSDLSGFSAS